MTDRGRGSSKIAEIADIARDRKSKTPELHAD